MNLVMPKLVGRACLYLLLCCLTLSASTVALVFMESDYAEITATTAAIPALMLGAVILVATLSEAAVAALLAGNRRGEVVSQELDDASLRGLEAQIDRNLEQLDLDLEKRFDTLVIEGADIQVVPREAFGGKVIAWSAAHALAELHPLENFVGELAAGCYEDKSVESIQAIAQREYNLSTMQGKQGWIDTEEKADA